MEAKLWSSQEDRKAFIIEEGILSSLKSIYGTGSVPAGESIAALAIAAAHYVQVLENVTGGEIDLKRFFTRQFNEAYKHYSHREQLESSFLAPM